MKLVAIVAAMIGMISCNVWDNLFSKYDSPLVPIVKPFSAIFDLDQFKSTLGTSLRVDFYGEKNAIAFTLDKKADMGESREEFSRLIIDFGGSAAELHLPDGQCFAIEIPSQAKIDITDLNNFLRYFTFQREDETNSDPENQLKHYDLNLIGIEQRFGFDMPNITLTQNSEGYYEKISVQILDEIISFTRPAGFKQSTDVPPPLQKPGLKKCISIVEEKKFIDQVKNEIQSLAMSLLQSIASTFDF